MDSLVLTLAIRWLEASDAFSASCVSREWRDALSSERDGGDLWKQISMNTNPASTRTLEATKVQQDLDYRSFTLGLDRAIQMSRTQLSFIPTLRPEDIFAVVELYRLSQVNNKRRRVVDASWVCPVAYPMIEMDEYDVETEVLQGLNPYSASMRDSIDARQHRCSAVSGG
jgi:hypothetical protein